MSTNIIEAEGLTKRFGTTQALDGVDLAAREGTVLGVLGPNGAGKTTAVRILATLLQADAGRPPSTVTTSSKTPARSAAPSG
jgi:oleandomycin transport system ATP-binding protein